MATFNNTPQSNQNLFLPEGSSILLVTHLAIGIFFLIIYFLFHSNIETIKAMILVYYTLFSLSFLFFYHKQLRIKRVFNFWCGIAAAQFIIFAINAGQVSFSLWSIRNVLTALTGLPLVLILYTILRNQSLKQNGKDLEIGVRDNSPLTQWDKAATYGIPLVVLLVCLF